MLPSIFHFLTARLLTLLLLTGLIACAPPGDETTLTGKPASAPSEDSLAVDTVDAAVLESGTNPLPRLRDYEWMSLATWHRLHEEDVAIAAEGGVDLLFIGDSITAGWDPELWDTHFAPYNAANFGIGGDHTGNVLWRLQNGAIGALQPKVVVLLIGVNNFGHLQETPEQVFAGVTAVVNNLQGAFPTATILVNGVFPYGQGAKTAEREQVEQLNTLLSTLGEREQVAFQDHSALFLEEDGTLSPAIMSDYLHLTPQGYRRWAEALLPSLHQWLALDE